MAFKVTALQLKQAGFTDDEVIGYINEQRPALNQAGFSNSAINSFYGVEPIEPIVTEQNIDPNQDGVQNVQNSALADDKSQTLSEKTVKAGEALNTGNETVTATDQTIVDENQSKLASTDENVSHETSIDQIIDDEVDGKPIPENKDTPDYNQTLYNTIAETNAQKDAKAAEMKANNQIYYEDLSDGEKMIYNRNRRGPKRTLEDGTTVTMSVIRKPKAETEKIQVLNTPVTTGPSSKAMLSIAKGTLGLEDDDVSTLNEAISFIAAIESDNRNINNEDGTKGGVFQIKRDEMVMLLDLYGNYRGDGDLSWKEPRWMEQAYIHKNPSQLSIDAQRALVITKLLARADALGQREMLLKAARGDKEAIKHIYTQVYNFESRSNDHLERVDDYFGRFNTFNYEFSLPEIATWSDGELTNAVKDFWVGRKFLKYTGGDGTQNAFSTGYRQSVTGLMMAYHDAVAINGLDPQKAYEEIFMHQTQNFGQDIVQMATGIVGDLPQIGVGFVGGVGLGIGSSAMTGGTTAPATPFIAFGTAFSLPETMRDVYIRAMMNGDVNNFEELMDEVLKIQTAKTFGKTTAVGSVSYGAGRFVSAAGGGKLSQMSAEAGTMITMMSALEGQVPSRNDFAAVAVLIFGAHGAAKGVNKLHHLYAKYGWHPKDVKTLAEQKPDVMTELVDPDVPEPSFFNELNEMYVSKLEEATGTKIVDPPKHNMGDEVNISDSSTETGKVMDRQEAPDGTVVLEVEKPSGETVYVPESQTSKAEMPNQSEVVVEGDKIVIKEAVETNFVEAQADGVFNGDIVETRSGKGEYKFVDSKGETIDRISTTRATELREAKAAVDVSVTYNKAEVQTGKNLVSNGEVFVNTQAYPNVAKIMVDPTVHPNKKGGVTRTEVNAQFKKPTKRNDPSGSKPDEVFTIRENGPTKVKVDTVILRGEGNKFYAAPRNLYDMMKRFVVKGDKDSATKSADAEFALQDGVLFAIDGLTNKVIGAMKVREVNGKLRHQAKTYYDNHIPKNDKVYNDSAKSSKGDNDWGIPDEPTTANSGGTIDNGIPRLEAQWKQMFNNQKGLDTYDLVQLTEALIGVKPIVERLEGGLRGYFQFGKTGRKKLNKEELKVVVNKALADDPKGFTMTLAHEIGHLIDYLPAETMSKGNILGSMAALKKYMNSWIDGKADGAKPLSKAEIDKLKAEATAQAKKDEPKVDTEIKETLNITPEKIKDILRDPDIRSKIDPEFYDAFAKLDGKLKKQILISAMKGMIDPHIKSMVDRINGKKPKTSAEIDMNADAEAIFKRRFEEEMRSRGLVTKEEITAELKALSQKWKPFDRTASGEYTKYRDGPRELMADFMMAFLLRPKWTALNAPKSFDLFMHHMHKRPDVKMQYEMVQNALAAGNDVRYSRQFEELANYFSNNRIEIVKRMDDRFEPNAQDDLQTAYIDTFAYFYRRFGGPNGWWGRSRTKRYKDEDTLQLNARIENFRYRHAYMQQYMQTFERRVLRPLEDIGYNSSQLSVMLLLRNLAFSSQRAGVATTRGLWSQIRDVGPEGQKIYNDFSGFDRNPMDAYQTYAKMHPALDNAATEFYNLRAEFVHPIFKESKAFDKETLDMMLNNREYITFDQANYMFKRLEKSGGVSIANKAKKRTTGSLGDITDPLVATLEKDLLLMTELKRNRLMKDSIEWLEKNKDWLKDFDANGKEQPVVLKAKFAKKGQVEAAPIGYKTVTIMQNGKPKHYHINKFAADAFEANPYTYLRGLKLLQSSNDFFRSIFTEYNPLFWGKNLFRDVNRAVRNLPNARYFDLAKGGKNAYMKYLFKSLKPTYKSIFGDAEGTALTRKMEKEGYLIAQMDGYHTKAGEVKINKMIENGDIPADAALIERMMQRFTAEQYETVFGKTFGRFFDHLGNIARFLERTHKVAGKMYLDDMVARGDINMSSAEMMLKVQADVGSPSFLRTSKYHPIMNNVFLFSNAMKEGIRGDYVRLREDPTSVVSKFIAYNVAPKMVQKMAKYGLYGTGLATFYMGVSEYDEQNYIVIPLGYTNDGRPVYFRIPQDETARVMNGFIGLAVDATFGEGKVGVTNFMKALDSDVLPQFAPIFGFMSDTLDFTSGNNPMDTFRNQYAIDTTTWEAQNMETKKAALKYMWNSYGGGSIYRFKTDKFEDVSAELKEIFGYDFDEPIEVGEGLDTPLVGTFANTFIKIGKHPAQRGIFDDMKVVGQEKARETLIFKDAMHKILSQSDDMLTKQEIMVVAKRSEYIKNNRELLDGLAKSTGGTEILGMLLTARTTMDKAIVINRLMQFTKQAPEDFPVLFQVE